MRDISILKSIGLSDYFIDLLLKFNSVIENGNAGSAFDATVEFSVNANPNTVGTTFSPNLPAISTVIYVSTIDNSQWTYNGTNYVTYTAPFWSISGNPSATASNFIGTTNNEALRFKTNNIQRLIIEAAGNVGIGVTPTELLHVLGSIRTNAFFKTPNGIAIGLRNGIDVPNYNMLFDLMYSGSPQARIGTVTATAAGGRAILNFTVGNGAVNALPGWRLGLNTSAFNNDNFTIDELNSGTFVQRVCIEKTTGNIGLNTEDPTCKLDINSDKFRLRTGKTPSSATDTGDKGDICWDDNYLYICIATNTWKRSAISTW